MTGRAERRAIASAMRRQRAAWPEVLTPVPESEWPPQRTPVYPVAVWRSRFFLVLRYDEPPFNGGEMRRLTVNRVTIGSDGHWEQDITWDELQRCKRETGHGDWYAVEVYPHDRDLVHDANMRHLWLLAEPLAIGWVKGAGA